VAGAVFISRIILVSDQGSDTSNCLHVNAGMGSRR